MQEAAAFILSIVLGAAAFFTALFYLWKNVISPLRERLTERRTARREAAFVKFSFEWAIEHLDIPTFILDENKRCTYVNPALCRMLHVDSSDFEGKAWHRLIRESQLSHVLAKWDEAYLNHSSYTNVSGIIVDGIERQFLMAGEPFIWNGKVRNFIGTAEPYDIKDILKKRWREAAEQDEDTRG